jgi:glutamine amidotransferase
MRALSLTGVLRSFFSILCDSASLREANPFQLRLASFPLKTFRMDIAIIDYDVGNLRSAEKAFQHLGFDAHLTQDPSELASAKKIVLPGVGAFGQCMQGLRSHGFVDPLLAAIKKGTPMIGICVGMQMLFEGSEESPNEKGLGLLKGKVVKFKGAPFSGPDALKIPQIGWNALSFPAKPHAIFAGLKANSHVYFVHSFHCAAANESDVLAWSDYGAQFCASAGRDNILGVQFHPEKSQTVGLGILKNFGNL